MSTTVDNRVVEMQFDNKQFERNVATSMSTIDKLNKSLQMTEGTKGLENIGNAAKRVDMSSLSGAVETIQVKFSSMQVMAVTALANITNSAVNAGKRIVSALTIDPIKTGLSEYETQMNAVQTILANTESKGSTLEDVNGALDELNTYADKTIYNFTEMTKNIGTFTAAGVDLDTSVKSIQGIANLAAVSGSTSQQASTAMYQLSQALAAGKVQLMDWNSVVNAGMGGQVFQDALKRTAKNMGTDVDALIKEYGSFRESLTKGEWLTADVLTKTLEQFTMAAEEGSEEWKKYKKALIDEGYSEKEANSILKMANTATNAATKVKTATQLWDTLQETAQSGWTQTWEIVLGDFEEAKEMFSKMYETLSPLIEAMSKSRNDLLQGWKDGGGRADLIDSLYNTFSGVMNIVRSLKKAFRQLFPPMTSKQLIDFTAKLKELTENFAKLTNSQSGSKFASTIGRIFKGVFATFSIGIQIVKGLFSGLGELFKRLSPTGSSLLDLGANIGDALVKFDAFLKKGNVFSQFFKGVATVIGSVVEWIRKFVVKMGDAIKLVSTTFTNGFNKFADNTEKRLQPLSLIAEGLKAVLSMIMKAIKKVAPIFAALASKVGEIFRELTQGIANAINNADYSTLFDMFNGGVIASILLGIRSIFKGISDVVSDFGGFWDGLKESLSEIKDAILDTFGAIQNNLKADMLKKIATAIGILAASLWLISTIDSDKLAASLGSVAVLFGELLGSMSIFLKMTEGMESANIANVLKVTNVMKGLATALLVLSVAMKIMSTMSWEEMGIALISIGAGLGTMIGALWAMPSEKKLNQSVKAIKKLSSSLIVFAVALKIMSTMSWQEMGVALISMSVGLGVLVGSLHLLPNEAKLRSSTKAIKKLASSLLVLSVALKIMGTMSWKEMGVALISMTAGIAAMVAAVNLLPKDVSVKSAGLISLATAMVILGGALKIMGSMSWKEMGVGLISLAGSLTAITAALRLMPKNTIAIGIGLIAVTTALAILAKVLTNMGGMSWEEIAKGLVTLAVSLGLLVAAMHSVKSALPGAAAMLVMAAALNIFIPQLKSLGSMSIGGLAIALIALAGSFTIMGLAAKYLAPLAPAMYKVAAAMAVLGLAVALFGAGVALLATGLSTLAVGASAIAGAIVTILSSVISLIPFLFEQLAAGIVAFCKVIYDGVPAIGKAIKAIVVTIIDILVECVPLVVDGILVFITEILSSLVEYVPKAVELIFQFLVAVIDGLAKHVPTLIQSLVNLLMSVFQGVVDALKTVDVEVLKEGLIGVGVIAGLMVALATVSALIPGAMIGVVGMGLVITELAFVLAAVGALAKIPGLTEFINQGAPLLQGIGKAIGSLIGGIIGGIAHGATSALPQVATNLSTFMKEIKPFIEGAKSFDASAMDGIKALAGAIIALTAANVLEGMTSWFTGGSSITKFASELLPLGKGLKSFSDSVAGISPENIIAASKAATALAEMTRIIPNEGGVIGWFAGENSISKFGTDIVGLGKGLKDFSAYAADINSEAIINASKAATALAEMTNVIPNEGGVVSWFSGDNSIAKFGTDIIDLGKGLKGFSNEVADIKVMAMQAAISVAKGLVEMTACIPNSGGVAAWFAGENSISKFGTDIIELGKGLKGFSNEVADIKVITMQAAISVAKGLAEMVSIIPNSGGIVAWFTGENSISKFGTDIIELGKGLKGFSDSVVDINHLAVQGAISVATSLAQMVSVIPNSGGVVAWFTGEASISKFGGELKALGTGLKDFSTAVTDINPGNMVMAAAAGKALAQMTSYIPTEGGIKAWLTGETSISKFGGQLKALGTGLKDFSTEVTDIVPENVIAAANAGKALAQMTSYIPTEGGMKAWFTGETNVADFADKLPVLGEGLKSFSDEVTEIVPENVTAAANAAKSLAQMTSYIPTEGGMKAWFTGKTNVADFANKLPDLGKGLKGFSDEVAEIVPGNVTAAANAAKTLAEMTKTTPKNTDKLVSFGENIVTFGGKLSSYFKSIGGVSLKSITASSQAIQSVKDSVSGFKPGDFTNAAKAIDTLVKSVKGMSKINNKTVSGFTDAMTKLAETSVSAILDEFKDAGTKMTDAGKDLIKKFIKGLENMSKDAKSAVEKIASGCVKSIKNVKDDFRKAGTNLVKGFANGITLYVYIAKKAAKKMAAAAAEAAKEELDEHSPSRVGGEIGGFFGLGFVNAINDFGKNAYKAGSSMAKSARSGLSDSIGKIVDLINNDMDTQPTIRPVMDLSNVKTGVDAISSMLGTGSSVGVLASVGSINSMMNRRSQNGTASDVVSAIKKLGDKIDNMSGDTYQINGVTYDDGSNINDAVKTIVRAARIERRV